MQIDQQQAHELDWRIERAAPETRSARALSIEELRQKFGLPLTRERREEQTAAARFERPRIVRRREAVAC
jgi:hypothetical protein